MGFWATTWADVATAIGFGIALAGIWFTIQETRKSKTAADAAKDAADRVVSAYSRYDLIVSLNKTRATLEEILRLQNLDQWPVLAARYTAARQEISALLAQAELLDRDDVDNLRLFGQQLGDAAARIESGKALSVKARRAELKSEISNHLTTIAEIESKVRRKFAK